MADKFIRTTAINKILAMTARKKVIQGGTSASKTYGILAVLINKAAKEPMLEISVVSETIPHLRRGAIKDFVKIMKWTGRWRRDHWNKTLLTYTFANGSTIEFFSADIEEKVRGPRRNILYINEANRIHFDIYHQLAIRTSHDIYLDFNPTAEFWAHTEVLQEPDSEHLILTYLDNEGLPPNVIGEINNAIAKANKGLKYWINWVNVYVHGKVGRLQGLVFEDWEELDEVPEQARLEGYGIDFGFATSPYAQVAVYTMDGEYYFEEVVYQTGLTNQQAVEVAKENGAILSICAYADYAEPKSIAEMRLAGMNVAPCASKQDIREYSIKKLQGTKFYLIGKNLVDNFSKYKWATDKTGQSTGKPEKTNDHFPDAIYYFIGTDDKYSGEY